MVSEKKIKMLKTTFVATQIEVLQVAPHDNNFLCITYITNMYKILGLNWVHLAGSCATNVTELVSATMRQIPQVALLCKQPELHIPNNIHVM